MERELLMNQLDVTDILRDWGLRSSWRHWWYLIAFIRRVVWMHAITVVFYANFGRGWSLHRAWVAKTLSLRQIVSQLASDLMRTSDVYISVCWMNFSLNKFGCLVVDIPKETNNHCAGCMAKGSLKGSSVTAGDG
ncbi:uncharacterized protein LOC131315672 [Rhododendron vialii]|uniref:uncharacterized protein LOC131315672 n=1 Tax=Rhododendron vialii TaxID=182163 RepID=UPI00265E2216|nr:uncharacterized protein LOC131315672 [Rhododendron vialii]